MFDASNHPPRRLRSSERWLKQATRAWLEDPVFALVCRIAREESGFGQWAFGFDVHHVHESCPRIDPGDGTFWTSKE
ncbi:hypothetical protein VTJ83DRAFT_6054 [Remersonia thermophila]|uniref:Uncharacterized protein n=1 Tax=Remersonia thermophila TaxID=72144 RepID=A0ABR4DAS3_9PEZI